jgi:hypothetical protein
MPFEQSSRAELLSDSAVYRRTVRGQRELLSSHDLDSPASRMLARVNGYTDLRALFDLALDEDPDMAAAFEELIDGGFVERVDELASDR